MLGLGVLVLGPVLCWGVAVYLFGGVRTIIAGEIFRSPQLSAAALQEAIEGYGIRSVLNLRGRGHGRTWYGEERDVCERAGITHLTVTFNVDEWPPRPVVLRFLEALEELAPPILVHCHRGIDRTGWAGGVVVLANGGSLDEAERQLSPAFGHICVQSKCPQHSFFAAYRRWLVKSGQANSEGLFRRWTAEIYCPDPWNAHLKFKADPLNTVVGGSDVSVLVEVTNQGPGPWRPGSSGIRLGVRMIGPRDSIPPNPVGLFMDRQNAAQDVARANIIDAGVEPDESRLFELAFQAPEEPGLYFVQVDMVKEHVHWFSEMGWPGLVWPLEIVGHEDEG